VLESEVERLAPGLLERVLEKLDFSDRPQPNSENLQRLYAMWCRRVPFDNVRKLIHMHAGDVGPLPGDDPQDFFTAWLAHGTGGTCWAGNGGLYALLSSLGYAASRGIATMLSSAGVPPNHGTVVVDLDGQHFLVDASILHGEPLHLDAREPGRILHPAWGVESRMQDGRWHIAWRPLHTPTGIDCRIERLGASSETFGEMHEITRGWSPFNYELTARLLRGESVVGVGFGQRVTLGPTGGVTREPLSDEDRVGLLVDDLGMSEEIARQLPPEQPTPPPPWASNAADTWLGQRWQKLTSG
jgi:N-hydroxyarylamine O-acetyltransferase